MILEELSNAIGVSGEEDDVRAIVIEAIRGHVSDLQVDALGNVTAQQRGTERPDFSVMIAAHMDEIGMMVTAVESNGLIQFTSVGGIDPRILPGKRVKVGADRTPGVILWKPIHLWRDMKTVAIDALRIDVGASDKSAAQPGDRIAFDGAYTQLSDTVVRGKAFDDRVGCSVLADIVQNGPYPVTVAVAFTAQEEIGLRGAQVAAQRLQPDAAIVLEGTYAYDLPQPDHEPEAGDLHANPGTRFGHGAVITLSDRQMITDPRVFAFLRETAEANDIAYQVKTMDGGGTDGGAIHIAHTGIPTMPISAPCRYIHTPAALLHLGDYASVLRLSQAVLRRITPDTFRRD
ncbi:MAG: M20/M25/M40 family metallo-hydrolase [Chloroflexi bacterium]|nr:M20/M25/M40 family metallo-hydrolase [Chloroflexota bacterium]